MKVQEKDVIIKPFQIMYLKGMLNKISTVSTDIKSIRKISELSRELKKHNETFEEMKETVIKDFKLEPNAQGGYIWNDNPKKKEIDKKFEALNKEEFVLTSANFLTEQEIDDIIEAQREDKKLEPAKTLITEDINYMVEFLEKK